MMHPAKDTKTLYGDYEAKMRKIADLRYAGAVLEWDQETYLPPGGAESRAGQLATLTSMAHELFTDARMGALLEELNAADGLSGIQKGNIARTLEDYKVHTRYPADFVRELSLATSSSYHAWMKARKENDYRVFEPELTRMVALKQKQAGLLGYQDHPYDALADDFEKGTSVQMLDEIFLEVKRELKGLLDQILAAAPPDSGMLRGHFDRETQWAFGMELLGAIGFDFSRGRQDLSEHPFTTSFNSRDVRLTTRIDESDFANMTWSCIHEGGHGLYEQGLPFDQYGLPLGEAASLAIHESQSRLWENMVGRGREFWTLFFPKLRKRFGESFRGVTEADFYRAINKVEPSLIRTESDELTYHFHVMIRYELEKKLLTGALHPRDLREAWNAMYHEYLGITVPDDKAGVLQDVHWSHGSFGYFPTYSLGSFYAAQFFHTASAQLPELPHQLATGETGPLLQWLREHIHRHGRLYYPMDLSEKVTGAKLQFKYFLDYAKKKYGAIYNL